MKRQIRGEYRVAKHGAVDPVPRLIEAFEQATRASTEGEFVKLITDFDLPREDIPTQWLNEVAVWDALLERMPMTSRDRRNIIGKDPFRKNIGPFWNDTASLSMNGMCGIDATR